MGAFIPGLISAGTSLYGAIRGDQANRWLQDAMINRLEGADRAIDFAGRRYGENYDMLNPFLQEMMQYDPYMNPAYGYPMLRDDMLAYRQSITPDAYRNPWYSDEDIANMQGTASRMDPAYDTVYDIMSRGGGTPETDYLMDRYRDRIGVPDERYSFGQNMISSGGYNQYNVPSINAFNEALSRGGWSPENRAGYDYGFDLMGEARGMNPMDIIGSQQWTPQMGEVFSRGGGLMDSAMAGDMSPEARAAIGAGNRVLDFSMGGGMSADSGPLQQYGTALMDRAMGGGGYTPQGQQAIDLSGDLYGRAVGSGGFINPQMQSAFDIGTNLLGGGNLGQISQMLGGFGGGGGASAGTASAASGLIGPVDPAWLQRMQSTVGGLLSGEGSNVMGATQRGSLAQDEAAAAASRGWEAAARQAALRGGGAGSLVGSGAQDRAMLEYADQISQAQAAARRQSLADYEQARLAEMGQALSSGGQIAGEETSRYGIQQNAALQDAQQRNAVAMANAGNQTQASIANANAANSRGLAQMQALASLYGQSLGAGTNLMQSALDNSSRNFLGGAQTSISGINDANRIAADRYAQELGTAGGLLTNFGQQGLQGRLGGTEAGLGAITSGAGTATSGRTAGLGIGAGMMTDPLNIAANRFGTEADLAGTIAGMRQGQMGIGRDMALGTMNLTPDMIRAYTGAAGIGMQDASGRLGMGIGAMNEWNANNLGYIDAMGNTIRGNQQYNLGAVNALPGMVGAQGNIFSDIGDYRLRGNQLGLGARQVYDTGMGNYFSGYLQNYLDPMMTNAWNAAGMRSDLANNWGRNWTSLNTGRMGISPTGMSQQPGMSDWLMGLGQNAANIYGDIRGAVRGQSSSGGYGGWGGNNNDYYRMGNPDVYQGMRFPTSPIGGR